MYILKILSVILCVVFVFSLTSCNDEQEKNINNKPYDDIDPSEVDAITETWVALELKFDSAKEYEKNAQFDVVFDVEFTHNESGEKLIIPAFWFEGNTFAVRFAPTLSGIWNYKTICHSDESLNGKTGKFGSNNYKGDLEIYKRGFVKTEGKKYFVYDDGTPFFYLADTHWSMLKEEFDSAGDHSGAIETDSHFKFIVDKRAQQGYTVYQSQPLGASYTLTNGFNESDLEGFKIADKYFQYLADKGFVHANAQFFFATSLNERLSNDLEYLEKLSRYWVARYGAYPVMWTLGQEVDYFSTLVDEKITYPWEYSDTNPWIMIAEYIHKYDAYNHPLTGHQLHQGNVTCETGKGAKYGSTKPNNGASLFASKEVTERTGHDFYGTQWAVNLNELPYKPAMDEYWNSPKVIVQYEGRYAYLWTKDFGARAQAWVAFLNGNFGVAYGAADMWLYKSTYDMDTDSVERDGKTTITKEEKQMHWSESINLPSGYQVAYMKYFFSHFPWWNLVPDLYNQTAFVPGNSRVLYACASDKDDVFVVYFYDRYIGTGEIIGMDPDATYTLQWFNPRTGLVEQSINNVKSVEFDGVSTFNIGNKPDNEDWVVYITKN